jgi:hypothetical protein
MILFFFLLFFMFLQQEDEHIHWLAFHHSQRVYNGGNSPAEQDAAGRFIGQT